MSIDAHLCIFIVTQPNFRLSSPEARILYRRKKRVSNQ